MKKALSVLVTFAITLGCFCFSPFSIVASANCSANDLVSVAKGEIGNWNRKGTRNKYTLWNGKIGGEYANVDNGYGYPWCATFVSWCAKQAGCLDVISKTASCNSQWANTIGEKYFPSSGYSPKPGDLIFYDYGASNNAQSLDHVGIVEWFDSSSKIVHTIEGNYSNSVKRVSRSYTSNDIFGFIAPRYNGSGSQSNTCSCSTNYAGEYIVTTQSSPLTMRSGHGTGYSQIGTIPKGAHVTVSKANGSWAHVSYNGRNGYCSMQYLSKVVNKPVNVDLGTDFYAYIINTSFWKHLTNDGCNVSIRTETGNANQVWKFDRQSDGSYKITNCKDGRVLDDSNWGNTNGANVGVVNSNNSTAQRWFIRGESGAYYLNPKCSELVLDVNGACSDDGTNVQIWTKNGTVAQKFQIWKLDRPSKTNVKYTVGTTYTPTSIWWDKTNNTNSYDLKLWKGGMAKGVAYKWNLKCTSCTIALPAGYYEAYIDSCNNYSCTMSNVIKFTVSEGSPVNVGDKFYANITENKNQLNVTNNNSSLTVEKPDKNSKNQCWYFDRQSDGSYTVKNCADGKYLDVYQGEDRDGTPVITYPYHGGENQRWYIYGSKSGEYFLKPKCAVRVLDVNGGKNNPGDKVQLWSLNYTDAQRFAINKLNNQPNNGSQSTIATISFSNMVTPVNINRGSSFNLKGTVSCSKPLRYVKAEIINSVGKAVASQTAWTSTYSFNIQPSNVNQNLKFGTLGVGNYTLRYTAVASDSTTKTVNYSFAVKSTTANISFSGMVVPRNITKGSSFNLAGTVSSSKALKYVKGEILNSSGKAAASQTVYTSSKSFSIKPSAINNNLKFGTLGVGSYTLRYTAAASDGTIKTASYSFKVNAKATNNSTSGKLNFNNSLNYARTYWNKMDTANGFYTSSGAKTYNPAKFSKTSGNNCANYVSAILLAGGMKTDGTWNRGSYAWINVNGMKNYFTNNKGIKYISHPSSTQIEAGDILYTSSGHVMFVTSAEWSGGRKIIKATGNTNSRDVNYQVSSFYGVLKTSILF